MSEPDPHAPMTAGPEPVEAAHAPDATGGEPAGVGATVEQLGEERPEVLVGAAFAGGLVAAAMLKGLARRRRR